MPENFENDSRSSRGDDFDLGRFLSNEANVFGAGIGNSFSKMGEAVQTSMKDPLGLTFKVGTAFALGGIMGLAAKEAVLGGVVRAAGIGMGTAFVFDTAIPMARAFGDAANARTQGDLDRASNRLATSLGQLEFDSILTIPAAGLGSWGGSALRKSFTVPLKVETPSATATPRFQTDAHRTSATNRTPRYEEFRRPQTNARRTAAREPEVLVGEVIDPPPRHTDAKFRRTEPEIIDAEWWEVVPNKMDLVKVNGDVDPMKLLRSGDALTLVERTDVQAFNIVGRNSAHQQGLRSALSQLQTVESGWSLQGNTLRSPVRTAMDMEQLAFLIRQSMPQHLGLSLEARTRMAKAAYAETMNPSEPTTGRIVNIKV